MHSVIMVMGTALLVTVSDVGDECEQPHGDDGDGDHEDEIMHDGDCSGGNKVIISIGIGSKDYCDVLVHPLCQACGPHFSALFLSGVCACRCASCAYSFRGD